jgi:hypothetical protein
MHKGDVNHATDGRDKPWAIAPELEEVGLFGAVEIVVENLPLFPSRYDRLQLVRPERGNSS